MTELTYPEVTDYTITVRDEIDVPQGGRAPLGRYAARAKRRDDAPARLLIFISAFAWADSIDDAVEECRKTLADEIGRAIAIHEKFAAELEAPIVAEVDA